MVGLLYFVFAEVIYKYQVRINVESWRCCGAVIGGGVEVGVGIVVGVVAVVLFAAQSECLLLLLRTDVELVLSVCRTSVDGYSSACSDEADCVGTVIIDILKLLETY